MIASSDRLWLSFGSGLLAAVNPCGFVLLPTYLMYFLGVSGRPGTQRATVRRALLVSAALSAGFMTVFVIVGGISRLFTDWLNQNAKYLALLIGVALVILGIAMLFGYRLPFSTPKLETGKRDQTIASMYIFGLAYAIASIGRTIGPFSATVFGMTYVETASAVVMILSGLYLSWYWFNDIRDKYDDDLTGRVLNWQERIAQYIDNNRLVLAIVFAVIVGSALTYTFVSRRRDLERSS